MKRNTRVITLAVALTLLAASVFVYIAVNGGTYTERLDNFIIRGIRAEDVIVTPDSEDVVTVERVFIDEASIVNIRFAAKKPGNTAVNVKVLNAKNIADENRYLWNSTVPLRVTRFGTIIQTKKLNFNGYIQTEFAVIGALALVFLTSIVGFLKAWRAAEYSYSMISLGGVSLFCLSMMTVVVYGMQWKNDFYFFLVNLLNTGSLFAMVSAPVMLFISMAISVSNIWLLAREGFRPQNMLGIVLGVLWTALLIPVYVNMPGFRSLDASFIGWVAGCISYVVSFLCCMILSTIACAFLATKHTPPYDRDYLVILGCCIRPDGTLTPILKGRTDAAVQFEQKQFAATGKHAKFVPSGGQGADEVISEGEAMERYLREQGYPPEQIIREDKSVNTNQNIQFSRDKIREDAGTLDGVKVGIATTNYHVFRSYVLAQKHGLDAQGISAKTKWYFYPNAFLREFVGLLWDKKIKIALIVTAMVALYLYGVYLVAGS